MAQVPLAGRVIFSDWHGVLSRDPFWTSIRNSAAHPLHDQLEAGMAGVFDPARSIANEWMKGLLSSEQVIAQMGIQLRRPLMARLRIELSANAYWRGMTLRSRDLAAEGLRYSPDGLTAADAHMRVAQAAADLGDAESARRAVALAHEARAGGHDDEVVQLGGEFSISQATHHYFAGAALMRLGGEERGAAEEIERAVALYQAGPGPGEQYSVECVARAGSDLAGVRIQSGDLDAAATVLDDVLSLPPAQRVTSVMARLRLVRTELAAPVFRGSARARELDQRIEDFGRDTITRGLHSLAP
jgi:hypothetical protein